jgi:hypothetical protein
MSPLKRKSELLAVMRWAHQREARSVYPQQQKNKKCAEEHQQDSEGPSLNYRHVGMSAPILKIRSGAEKQDPNQCKSGANTRLNDPECRSADRACNTNLSSQKPGSRQQLTLGKPVLLINTSKVPQCLHRQPAAATKAPGFLQEGHLTELRGLP